jgi:hypothetical protein
MVAVGISVGKKKVGVGGGSVEVGVGVGKFSTLTQADSARSRMASARWFLDPSIKCFISA